MTTTDPRILKYYGLLDEQEPQDDFGSEQKMQDLYKQADPGLVGTSPRGNLNDYFSGRDSQLLAAMNKSGAQLGTLHGKVADTSAVQDFANAIGNQRERLYKTEQAQNDRRDGRTKLRLDVLKYLNDKNADQKKGYNDRLSKYGEGELGRQNQLQRDQNKQSFDAGQNSLDRSSRERMVGEKAPSEAQSKYANYAKDASTANRDIEAALKTPGYDRTNSMQSFKDTVSPNLMTSVPSQLLSNAEINFANAVSRGESGMNVKEDEYARYQKLYFPRSGDSPEVVAQKERNRQQKIMNLESLGGRVYQGLPTAPEVEPTSRSTKRFLGEGAPPQVPLSGMGNNEMPVNMGGAAQQNSNSPKEGETRTRNLDEKSRVLEKFQNGRWNVEEFQIKG